MSKESILNEATAKMIELESIVAEMNARKNNFGEKRALELLIDLTEVKYANVMVGNQVMLKWMRSLNTKFAEHYNG